MKKNDYVQLKDKCDSPFLFIGDKGRILSEVLEDGYVAVEFDEPFGDSHDCNGLVKSANGWFIELSNLEKVKEQPGLSNVNIATFLEKQDEAYLKKCFEELEGFRLQGVLVQGEIRILNEKYYNNNATTLFTIGELVYREIAKRHFN